MTIKGFQSLRFSPSWLLGVAAGIFLLLLPAVQAEQCYNANDMDAATRGAMERAAVQYFNDFASGNAADLQRNANASLAANFAGVQAAMTENQPVLSGGQATARATYQLET